MLHSSVGPRPPHSLRSARSDPVLLRAILAFLLSLSQPDILPHLRDVRGEADGVTKQILFGDALRFVSQRSDWAYLRSFNHKTTSFRTLGKALREAVKMSDPSTGKSLRMEQIIAEQKSNDERASAVFLKDRSSPFDHSKDAIKEVEEVEVAFDERITPVVASHVGSQLAKNGIAVIRAAVPASVCHYLLGKLQSLAGKKTTKFTKLAATMGLGGGGKYVSNGWKECDPVLRRISKLAVEKLKLVMIGPTEEGGEEESEGKDRNESEATAGVLSDNNTKAVPLGYIEGGVNWAHQDDNAGSRYQMLLMLSEPKIDFDGGELYSLRGPENRHGGEVKAEKGEEAKEGKCSKGDCAVGAAGGSDSLVDPDGLTGLASLWEKTRVKFESRGDLVVFRANGSYFHGMEEVRVGKAGSGGCERIAVGLLHPQK